MKNELKVLRKAINQIATNANNVLGQWDAVVEALEAIDILICELDVKIDEAQNEQQSK
jgi:hypothetical protein